MTRDLWLTRRGALKTGAIAAGVTGVGTRSGVAQDDESPSDGHCYYQVDFVAGDPIETLGRNDDAFYGRQNRLIQYVHVDGDHVIERDTWINSLDLEIRRCVTAEPIQIREGTASVEFTVADGCERRFSLAVYPLPGGEFSFDGQQVLAVATMDTFGPGTHELTVEHVRGTVCPPSSTGYEQRAKLVADDADSYDGFGLSVAVSDSGDTAVISAPGDQIVGAGNFGSAYVFGRANETWTQRAKLTADDAARDGSFGGSVGVSGSGETAVIGAYGGAYVFERTDGFWTQRAKFTIDDATEDDTFGESVAVSGSGETAVVGTSGDDDADESSGSAYVFGRTDETWTQRAKLTAADAAGDDSLGESVAVSDSGETAVIGAHTDDTDAGRDAGSAYVFSRTDGTWTQRTKLTAPDADPRDRFGGSVAVSGSGDTAVIGAYYDDTDAGRYSGSAYVFGRANGTWTQRAKLTAADAAIYDYFGSSVAVSGSGNTVVVIASGDDTDVADDFGSAYVFGRTDETWIQRAKLIPDDAWVEAQFGTSVAVSGSGETVAVGAPNDYIDSMFSGSAYVFGR